MYVPILIRDAGKLVTGRPAPTNIWIPVQGNCHAENPEFFDFVTNYVTSETDSMVGHDLIDNIMNYWNQICHLEVVDDEVDISTCWHTICILINAKTHT